MSNIMNVSSPEAHPPLIGEAASNQRDGPRFRLTRRWIWRALGLLTLLAIVVLAAFGPLPWQLLAQGMLLLVVAIGVLIALVMLLITGGIAAITRKRTAVRPWLERSLRMIITLGILLVGVFAATLGSQWHASTSPILGANGQPVSGSIATVEQVTLNGSQQWITIRGKNIHNPVLLFLMGGPGAGGFPDNSLFLTPASLEDHFVVVNWDQPGTGKSSHAVPTTLTPQRYVDDAYALTQLLRALPSGQDLCVRLVLGHHSWHQAGPAKS